MESPVSPELFGVAKENLSTFVAVGQMSRLKEFGECLQEKYNLKDGNSDFKLNINKFGVDRSRLSAEVLDKIAALNYWDQQLVDDLQVTTKSPPQLGGE